MTTAVQTATRPETYASLQQRIALEENRITHGLNAGRLSPKEAAAMRAQLKSLEARLKNDAFDANGLSHGQQFDRQLDRVNSTIGKQVRDLHMDLDKRVSHTQARIDAGLKNGTLTKAEASQLQGKLDALKQRYAGAKIDQLSGAERRELGQQLDALNHDVSKERGDAQANFQKRLTDFKARIAAGKQDGTLNTPEGQRLTKAVEQLEQRLAGAKLGGLDPKERSAIEAQMQHLSQRIHTQRHDTQVDAGKLATTLGQRIDAAANANKLPAAQATALRNELAALQQAAAAPGLNATQRANLAAQLNTLGARIQAAIRR